ncbi:FecCD family ABC transporter permease [Cryobacterium roopkundense]|uniref:Iron complex transport system permease protein n=1 Tax=Cryobacterium roopkundense TaxID=1001240 RepID=A0A7W8ZVB3_9MICO|nr:iron ABC transporter permease [Cryobacterium roopkundense]MBB5640693.1 iron complex transport system permease protein [Cryobacterium roopkundense]
MTRALLVPRPARRAAVRRQGALGSLGLRLILGLLIVVTVLVSSGTGPVDVSPSEALRIIVGHLVPNMPWMLDGSITLLQDQAVWQFRLPRVLMALLAGGGLALAGTLMQAVVRNPLAEPYILGVSAGAGVGAVLVIVLGSAVVGGLTLQAAAFGGALVATTAVYLFARQRGAISPTRLILAGVALGSLFSAITSYLTITTDAQNVFSVLFFLLGSVSAVTMNQLAAPAVVLAVVLLLALTQGRSLNALLMGDEAATSLGVSVQRLRGGLLVATALLTGTIVSVAGGIGFVGLVIPHVCRILVGSDHRRMLPAAVLAGGLFLALADLLARTVAAPTEIPLGILTALVGAPFFLWLMRRKRAGRAGLNR